MALSGRVFMPGLGGQIYRLKGCDVKLARLRPAGRQENDRRIEPVMGSPRAMPCTLPKAIQPIQSRRAGAPASGVGVFAVSSFPTRWSNQDTRPETSHW